MGNTTQKLNRKLDELVQKAYALIGSNQKDDESDCDSAQQDQQEQEENKLESVIQTSITKEEYLHEKRKSQIDLIDAIDISSIRKKVCI